MGDRIFQKFKLPEQDRFLSNLLTSTVSDVTKQAVDAKEKYLTEMLANPEVHYLFETDMLVFEEGPMEIENLLENDIFSDLNVQVRFTQKFRLRRKTDEEVAAEKEAAYRESEEFKESQLADLLNLADDIGEKIAKGHLPPQDENGFYIL